MVDGFRSASLLAPLALAVAIALAWAARSSRGIAVPLLPRGLSGWRWRLAEAAPRMLRLGGIAALATAAAGPARSVALPATPDHGVAVMIALDVSQSMREGSLGDSTRLEVAIRETRRFLAGRQGDHVGIVAFAAEASTLVPVVPMSPAVAAALDRVGEMSLGDGTALGTAIGVAAGRLRASPTGSRVLVVLSDGENNAGPLDPGTAARAAAAVGVRVYAVGIGDGAEASWGRAVEEGGGRYFQVQDRSSLDEAYAAITSMEPSAFAKAPRQAQVPATGPFLWLALILLVGESGIRGSRWGVLP